jgi:hypothetical protein
MLNKLVSLIQKTVLFMVLIFLISCHHHLIPRPQDVNPERVPIIELTQTVTLENIQPSKESIRFGKTGAHIWEGNLYEWTNKTIVLLRTELEKRGCLLSSEGTATLKLSVKQAVVEQRAFVGFRCLLTLHVEAGNGYESDYSVVNNSGGVMERASGGAITLAITEVLNDEKILAYLK